MDDPRRPGSVDDLSTGGSAALRLGSDQDPRSSSRLPRQPVFGESVPDASIPPAVSGTVRVDAGRQEFPGPLLPRVPHDAPSQRPGMDDPPLMSMMAPPGNGSRSGRPYCGKLSKPIRNVSSGAFPRRLLYPRRFGSTNRERRRIQPRSWTYHANRECLILVDTFRLSNNSSSMFSVVLLLSSSSGNIFH